MLGKSAKEQKLAELLLEKDTEILSKISSLQESIDAMSKGNKKFLMAATMNEGKYERLEQEILDIKFGAIELLDQFDIILAAIYNSESDELKNGVSSFYKKICSVRKSMGVEEIETKIGALFDPTLQECKATVFVEDYENDAVVGLVERGYRDLKTGNILRYAGVSVNKLEKKEGE